MKIIRFIKNTIDRTKTSIINLKITPLDSLGQLIPVVIGLTALVNFLMEYIPFLASGEYAAQFELIKENGFDGISETFTEGVIHILNRPYIITINILLTAEIIIMLTVFFKREHMIMKVLTIIDLVVIAILTGIAIYLFHIVSGKVELSIDMQEKIIDISDRLQVSTFDDFIMLFVIADLAAGVVFLFLC